MTGPEPPCGCDECYLRELKRYRAVARLRMLEGLLATLTHSQTPDADLFGDMEVGA